MHLLHIRSHTLILSSGPVESQHGDDRFVYLGTVINAATGKNHSYFRHNVILFLPLRHGDTEEIIVKPIKTFF
jgi:hypothetical protein